MNEQPNEAPDAHKTPRAERNSAERNSAERNSAERNSAERNSADETLAQPRDAANARSKPPEPRDLDAGAAKSPAKSSAKRDGPRHTWVFPLMSALFKAYLSVGGWRVTGRGNIPTTGAVILAPNHASLLDPPLVGVSCGRAPFIMAKAELFSGVVGWAIEQMGSFPVRRGGADRAAFKRARKTLENGEPLLVFPEGTRTRTGELGRAEPGLLMIAHAAKCPVVPVLIRGTERAFSPRRPGFRFVRARITFGQPVDFSDEYAQKGGRELFEHMGDKLMRAIEALQ